MSFLTPKSGNTQSFSATPLVKPFHKNVLSQDIERPEAVTSQAASIYGGATSSLPNTSSIRDKRENASFAPTSSWSPSVQTMLDQPPSSLPQRLIAGGMVFCLAFGVWATVGQIDEVGHAQGQLVPKGDVYKIAPEGMGKVATIAVKEGESVKAGDVLVELDTEIATVEVERLEQLLSAYAIELNQKQTLLTKAHLEARTRSQITEAEVEAQKAAIAQTNAKQQALTKLLTQNQVMVAADQQRLESLTPLAQTAQELLNQRQVDAVAQQDRLASLTPLLSEGAISKEYVFQAQQNLRDRQSAITQSQLIETANTKEQIFQAQQSLYNRQSAITQSQGELQETLALSVRLKAELAQKQAEGQRIQLEAQQQIEQLEVEITQLKAKIVENQNLLTSAKARLKQRFLYAPVSGVVSTLNIGNIGEVVQPGQTLAEIAPHDAPLILSASLPNREAGLVKTGMPVQVKLDAYPYQNYGIISGKVLSISPDAKPDGNIGSVYRVEVALDRNYVTANHRPIQFKPGQTASADIIIRRRRIVDILLDPIKQLQKGGIHL